LSVREAIEHILFNVLGPIEAEADGGLAGFGVQRHQAGIRCAKNNGGGCAFIAGPIGNAAACGPAFQKLVAPQFLSGLWFKRDHAVVGRGHVEHIIDYDGRGLR
jgi:hypothetical protein